MPPSLTWLTVILLMAASRLSCSTSCRCCWSCCIFLSCGNICAILENFIITMKIIKAVNPPPIGWCRWVRGYAKSGVVVGSLAGLWLREESDDEMRDRGMERVPGLGSAGRIRKREKPTRFLCWKDKEHLIIHWTSFLVTVQPSRQHRFYSGVLDTSLPMATKTLELSVICSDQLKSET